MSTVAVRCALVNGVVLRVDEMVADPALPGLKTARRRTEFELRPGMNDVDADVWQAWLEQHKDDQLVKGEMVKVIEEQPR